jgi:C4-dicarboxylate-specific signal transduction histidine kinase
MSFLHGARAAPLRYWTAAHIACLLSIAAGAIIGIMAYAEFSGRKPPEDDASWPVFEFGFEFQRLLLAAEKGESLEDIMLRGDIYLSRVLILRDAPVLAELREGMIDENLTRLFRSAQETERLLAGLNGAESRDALLLQLRSDAGMVRKLTFELLKLDRMISWEEWISQDRRMLMYLVALELFMLALLGLGVLVFRTTRKLRETGRELSRQLATQQAILKSVDTAILGLSPLGNVLYSNPYALSLLGQGAASGALLTGGGGDGRRLISEISALLRTLPLEESAHGFRKVTLTTDAGTRHYVIRASSTGSLPAEGGEATEESSYIVAITDVTMEQEAALRRDEYDSKLEEASRLLAYAAMSGGIVHEISQPLAAIRNYAYALKVSLSLRPASSDHRAIAERLGEEAERAMEVVRNVRRMGPQDTDEMGVCDIHEAISHSVRLVTLGANPAPPITFLPGEDRVLVAGSLPMIGQVVVNLLKNALSASSAAGRAGADVSVTLREDSAEIAVADFGTGVSADAAQSMFSPFTKSSGGGMGLGLAICQRIATSLGGSLCWENGDTAGAIFRFTIPLAKEGDPS